MGKISKMNFFGYRKGASLAETGILVGLVAIVSIGAVNTAGGKVASIFCHSSNAIPGFQIDCAALGFADLAEAGSNDTSGGSGGGSDTGGPGGGGEPGDGGEPGEGGDPGEGGNPGDGDAPVDGGDPGDGDVGGGQDEPGDGDSGSGGGSDHGWVDGNSPQYTVDPAWPVAVDAPAAFGSDSILFQEPVGRNFLEAGFTGDIIMETEVLNGPTGLKVAPCLSSNSLANCESADRDLAEKRMSASDIAEMGYRIRYPSVGAGSFNAQIRVKIYDANDPTNSREMIIPVSR